MKKTLLLLASAALLLVGCAKEKFAEPSDGGLTKATFSVSVDGGVATKAFADGDGKGTNVNRCIMEIYFNDVLYTRLVQPVTPASENSKAFATFANVPVVAGKEYQVLFWADHVDVVNTEAGLATDKYYTTKTTTNNKGLKAVAVNKTEFIEALKNKKNDKLDAFFGADKYTVGQTTNNNFNITLYRPFAQLNVITTDINKTVTSADLLPEKVSVSYEAANTINVATGETSKVGQIEADYTFAYEAPVYGETDSWSDVKNRGELTLSMDYILASTEQGAVDVTFKTKNGTAEVMTHNLSNLPYQRNYRTNVKGDLLTTGGSWTAKIDPIWSSPDIVKVVEVADIKSANQIINQYASTTKQLEVKFTAEPNDSGVPAGEEAGIRAIVTTPIQQDASLSIEVLTPTKELYIGDYKSEYIVSGEDVIKTDANHAVVNVNVPESSSIVKLVINAPSKSVYINGKEVANVGTITNLDAITSQNTLIIEPGQTVSTLTIRQGGLEIHGTVGEAIVPDGHGQILVRDCENLGEELVYNVLKDHIAEGYVGVKDRTTAGKWDIVPIVCKIGEIGYGSLADAVAKVQEGQTITLVKDIENAAGIAINTGTTFTIDFNNHKYTVNKPGAGSTGTQTAAFQLIEGQTITFKNGIIKAAEDNLTAAVAPAKNIKRMFQSYANVTFEGMIIDGTNLYENNSVCEFACGAVDIKGTTSITTGKQGVAVINVDTWKGAYPEGAQVTISSTGEFGDIYLYAEKAGEYTKSSLTITDGKFGKVYGDDSGDWTASISGGVFSEKPADEIVAVGYAVLENPDATTKAQYPWAVDRKGVAKIGTTIYYTLADAVADVPANTQTTITMIDNHDLTGGVTIPSNKTVILELNGKTISYSIENTQWNALITNRGTLTIQDNTDAECNGSGTGMITGDALSPDLQPVPGYASNTITNYGNLTVKSGSIINLSEEGAACYPIDNNTSAGPATLVIDGGRLYRKNSTALRIVCFGAQYLNKVTVNGGIIEGYSGMWVQLPQNDPNSKPLCSVEINGGLFEGGGYYPLYDYSYGASFENTSYVIKGGQFNGDVYCQGANINISGGSFDGKDYGFMSYGKNTTISGGSFEGNYYGLYASGTNINISGGVFKSDIRIKDVPSNVSITDGKFDADILAYGTDFYPCISGGLFKTYIPYEGSGPYSYWFYEICESKSAYYLEETDPAYAEGYRYIVQ